MEELEFRYKEIVLNRLNPPYDYKNEKIICTLINLGYEIVKKKYDSSCGTVKIHFRRNKKRKVKG